MFLVRRRLAAYKPATEHAPIEIGAGQFEPALRDHARLAQQGGKNPLMPAQARAMRTCVGVRTGAARRRSLRQHRRRP